MSRLMEKTDLLSAVLPTATLLLRPAANVTCQARKAHNLQLVGLPSLGLIY